MPIWQYSSNSPVFLSKNYPDISHNNFIEDFLDAKFLGFYGVHVLSMQERVTSCVRVRRDVRVFWCGMFSSLSTGSTTTGCGCCIVLVFSTLGGDT